MRMLKRRFPLSGVIRFLLEGLFYRGFSNPLNNKKRATNEEREIKILRLVNGVCKYCLRGRLRRWLSLSWVIALLPISGAVKRASEVSL